MPPPAAAVAVEGLSLHYGPVKALDNVTLAAGTGEVLCLLGPSGSGKSTLLRLIAGLARPTAGRVHIGDREVSGPELFVEPEARRVGMVFQDFALFPHLTVAQNVAFGLRGRPRRDIDHRVASLLDRVHLGALADRYPHMLSGGERQRVALARALAPEPRVVLMDEPFSSLDGALRNDVREEAIALVRDTGATTVIVTHEPDEALRIGDRIALVERGRLVESGTPRELYAAPKTMAAARLFGHLNEVTGLCRNGRIETPLGSFEAANLGDAAFCSVCIRPEHLCLTPGPACAVGRVLRTTFLGGAEHLLLQVPGIDTPLAVRHVPRTRVQPNQLVNLDVRREAVFIMPRPKDGAHAAISKES